MMDGQWPFELVYDFVERRWGTLAAWLITLAIVGAFTTAVVGLLFWLA
jgi:hypothetical protein